MYLADGLALRVLLIKIYTPVNTAAYQTIRALVNLYQQ